MISINKSIVSLILVAAFAVGYLYYSQSIQPTQLPIEPLSTSAKDDLDAFKDIAINFSALDNPVFKSLKTFGELPVKPGVTGKTNPFSPF